MEIKVVRRIMEMNEQHAEVVRQRLREAGVVALNLIGAPGSGKTSLIECAIRELKHEVGIGVIEGDPDTTRDAERIAQLDVPVVQINTEGGCHLEATMVLRALDEMNLNGLDLLFIENVGNLVCPVVFDLWCSTWARRTVWLWSAQRRGTISPPNTPPCFGRRR